MGVEMHFVAGRVIQTAFSPKGKWKIATAPGKARYFGLLSAAKKWAKANPLPEPTTTKKEGES